MHVTVRKSRQHYAFLLWVIDNCSSCSTKLDSSKLRSPSLPLLRRAEMVKNTKILDIRGKSLKLNTAADVTPLLEDFDPTLIEEVHLGGNTIGIEAAQEFSKFLDKTQYLKVSSRSSISSCL